MNAVRTLLWLEFKRSAWVIYGAAVAVALFALVLASLPGTTSGLDMLDIPVASEPPDCLPPDCESSGHSQFDLQREESEGASSFSWSFNKQWGGEPDNSASATAEQSGNQSVSLAVPEELQFTIRWRQIATVAASIFIPALMLLGFWIAYNREVDRGDMVMLYQSPISGDFQLFVRFVFMSMTMLAVSLGVIAIYWTLQKSQSLAPLAPLVEALGGRADLHWGSLIVVGFTTLTLPNVAFVLLFVQMQNAYKLLGGQRLAGFVLILVSLVAFAVSFAGGDAPEPGESVLRIVSVASNPLLDGVINTSLERIRIEVGVQALLLNLVASAVMLVVSGRIWREVEWS